MAHDRRTFLQGLLGAGAFAAASFPHIQRALAIPAHSRCGTLEDVEHIVILMQENRSFDHYFGAMKGVRGFGDPRAVLLPSGDPVWMQPSADGPILPYRPEGAEDLGLSYLVDLPHGWNDTQKALAGGKYDKWIAAKTPQTMAYLTREDIPFHYALADAFTVCDAYYCSFPGSTDPNRYHMWTGWVGNDGLGGGPVLDNAEAGYDWKTYPERLQQAGVTWKIYQDAGAGLDAAHSWGWGSNAFIGNYGDNSLLYFHQYQNAAPGSPLFKGARTATNVQQGGTLFAQLAADVTAGKLPQVSWICAPEAYTEHGNWPANWGAWYVDQVLAALTSNPAVWSKTVFLLMFDENDGFFDHMIPPTPPMTRAKGLSTVDAKLELVKNKPGFVDGPIGLGVRVPMTVISPWSKGGWVNSEVFDHTSLIRFIQARFGVAEPNITPWRRAVCGDLTSCFDFRQASPAFVSLPSTTTYKPTDFNRYANDTFVPEPPSMQSLPKQEPGIRPARALPYELHVRAEADCAAQRVRMRLRNTGTAASVLHVRSGNHPGAPWTYTVGVDAQIDEIWEHAPHGLAAYDLAVYGPNGFHRLYRGSFAAAATQLVVRASYDVHDDTAIEIDMHNVGDHGVKVRILDAYTGETVTKKVTSGHHLRWRCSTEATHGWYDLGLEVDGDTSFRHRLAGHVENGHDSTSDPALGW